LMRSVLTSQPLDETLARNAVPILASGEIWLTEDGSGLTECLCGRLELLGYRVQRMDVSAARELSPSASLAGLVVVAPRDADDRFLEDALQRARVAGPALQRAGSEGGSLLVTISRLDGHFGLRNALQPISGGLAGLVKTASHEWSDVA